MTSLAKRRRPALVLIILILLFGVPLLVAWVASSMHESFGLGKTSHGQLILPPLDLNQLVLHDDQAQPLTSSTWKGRWLLLYVHPNVPGMANPNLCQAECEGALYNMRQIRTATGKNSDRVARAILTFSDQGTGGLLINPPELKNLHLLISHDFNGTMHFITTTNVFANFVYNTPGSNAVLRKGAFYLVDPLGNVMMYYPSNADPMGIFKDLTRLLKLSHIG